MQILYFLLLLQPVMYAASSSGQYLTTSQQKSRTRSSLPVPPKDSSAFAMMRTDYTVALNGLNPVDNESTSLCAQKIKQSVSRCEIMQCIERLEKQRKLASSDPEAVSCELALHWQGLRDTYDPGSVEYSRYNQKAILEEQFRIFSILTDEISSPNESTQNELRGLHEQVAYYSNDETLSQAERTKLLSLVFSDIETVTQDENEKKLAAQQSLHYARMHVQIALPNEIKRLESLIEDTFDIFQTIPDDYVQLERALTELRSTYPALHPAHQDLTRRIAQIQLDTLYYLGEFDNLNAQAATETCQYSREHLQRLANRLASEQALSELLSRSRSAAEEHQIYVDLLNTFETDEPGYRYYANKVAQSSLLVALEVADSSITDPVSYWETRISLKEKLAETYQLYSDERAAVLREIQMLKDIKIYTQAFNHAQARLSEPNTPENVRALPVLLMDLRSFACHVNETHESTIIETNATPIKTEWIEDRIRYYELLTDFANAEQSDNYRSEETKDLVRAIIASPYTTASERKDFLRKQIDLIKGSTPLETATLQVRFVRDELIPSATLNQDEDHWQSELLKLNITRQIRTLRDKLDNSNLSADEQNVLNNQLRGLYDRRKELMQELA